MDTFDYTGPAVVQAMRNITVGVFEHLETTSPMDVGQRVGYTQHIFRVSVLKKYRMVLAECKESAKGIDVSK